MENPYSAPAAFDQRIENATGLRRYGGIGRLAYLGIAIVLAVVQNVVAELLATEDDTRFWILLVNIFFLFLSIIPVYYRLKNTGMNPWGCLLMIVPIANLFIGIRCLVCQEGYADSKKLDTAGKVAAFIVVGLFLLLVVGLVIFMRA